MNPIPPSWATPTTLPTLTRRDVHLWLVDLDDETLVTRPLLSVDEQQRAATRYSPQAQRRFIAAHVVLRYLISAYTAQPPADIELVKNAHGKPALAHNPHDLQFNMSHSHGLALYGFTHQRQIGVDVEHHHTANPNNLMQLAHLYFAPQEVRALAALPPSLRVTGFYNAWTRKEAYLKAIGLGLSFPLNQFAVSLHPQSRPCLLWVQDAPHAPDIWHIESAPLSDAATFAAAVPEQNLRFSYWRYGDVAPLELT
jgi:4'-phosphopantetheinyl transferase